MSVLECKGDPWCRRFDHPIDYDLVKIRHPPCIDQHRGCANCPECGYKKTVAIDGKIVKEVVE